MLPILQFEPRFTSPLWGGHRLAGLFGRTVEPHMRIGESWQLSDVPAHHSIVSNGPLSGTTVSQIIAAHQSDLMGSVALAENRFPLLCKFIDAQQTLSVQVHPDKATARQHGGEARSKHEAWYIIECAPGARLFLGLKNGVTRSDLTDACAHGDVEACLRSVTVQAGDVVDLPPGTVHAIGAGIVLAEVQQPSDTTYRLFDWNRRDDHGHTRELHIDKALECIDFDSPTPVCPQRAGIRTPDITCPFFDFEVLSLHQKTRPFSFDGPVVCMGTGGTGSAQIRSGEEIATLTPGTTLLLPACRTRAYEITAHDDIQLLHIRPR